MSPCDIHMKHIHLNKITFLTFMIHVVFCIRRETGARKKQSQIVRDETEVVQGLEQLNMEISEPEENPKDKPHNKKDHPTRTSEVSSIESLTDDLSSMGGSFHCATPPLPINYLPSQPSQASAAHPGASRPPFFLPQFRHKLTHEPSIGMTTNTGVMIEPTGPQLDSVQSTDALVPYNFQPFVFGTTNNNNGEHSVVPQDGSQVGGPNGQYFTMTSE